MTIPNSNPVKASVIRTELKQTGVWKIGDTKSRTLANKPSGVIKFSDFKGKSLGASWTGTGVAVVSGSLGLWGMLAGALGSNISGGKNGPFGSLTPTTQTIGNGKITFYGVYFTHITVPTPMYQMTSVFLMDKRFMPKAMDFATTHQANIKCTFTCGSASIKITYNNIGLQFGSVSNPAFTDTPFGRSFSLQSNSPLATHGVSKAQFDAFVRYVEAHKTSAITCTITSLKYT